MNYSEIEKLVQGKHLPVAGHNEDEENMIVERGADSAGKFFRLTTCQHNGWLRINTYYVPYMKWQSKVGISGTTYFTVR